ncbi:MAG: efflux RND transporter periplasmic adaptor subunit [Planctomycetes bacterium]|nr:efflux RND transporter periplasmic adaptor subunit [Planctomycetota bacterium]
MGEKRSGLRPGWLLGGAVLALLSVAGWYVAAREKPASDDRAAGAASPSAAVPVEVVAPVAGGLDRVCVQPGTVEPFESADLYAKVSGYLVEQTVDIGYPVRQGDVLARISVPEFEKQVKQDTAEVERAEAKVEQMTAAVTSAEADLGAATAGVALAQAEAKSKASYRAYREKQRDRFRQLAADRAIDQKLVDEQEDQFQAAVSADLAAGEAVNTAKQKVAAADARVKQARADLKYARAEVAVAKARLEKSEVLLGYTVIRSPYTGVVTKRNFHPGDFVRSADAGGERVPVLAVERTDLMRVVIQIPDRDVPFVDVGDAAEVAVDALPGMAFKTAGAEKVEVARLAASEDPRTRMMRVEVHLKNPTGKIRHGMYGRVTLRLQAGASEAVRIPSAALHGKAEGGKASVRVVRDDIAHVIPVRYGADNGTTVEVLSGLTLADRVVVRASGPVESGTAVAVGTASPAKSGH